MLQLPCFCITLFFFASLDKFPLKFDCLFTGVSWPETSTNQPKTTGWHPTSVTQHTSICIWGKDVLRTNPLAPLHFFFPLCWPGLSFQVQMSISPASLSKGAKLIAWVSNNSCSLCVPHNPRGQALTRVKHLTFSADFGAFFSWAKWKRVKLEVTKVHFCPCWTLNFHLESILSKQKRKVTDKLSISGKSSIHLKYWEAIGTAKEGRGRERDGERGRVAQE